MVCDDRLGSTNMFTNLPIDHVNTSIAESSGRATSKGSPTRVLENRANQLPQFSADELAIHCSPYSTLQAHAKPTIENSDDTHNRIVECNGDVTPITYVRSWLDERNIGNIMGLRYTLATGVLAVTLAALCLAQERFETGWL